MTTRRQALLPLALLPVAGWAIWATGAAEPPHPPQTFHLPLDDHTALWRELARVRGAGLFGGSLDAPSFPASVRALDGTRVSVRGFMLPLREDSRHSRFILSANPVGCPACDRANPAILMDVRARRALPLASEPLVLTGTLRLEPDAGLFYRLDRAEPIPA